jgi:Cu-Zn family superoxide dismutase
MMNCTNDFDLSIGRIGKMINGWAVLGLAVTLAACSSMNSALQRDPTAIAMLAPTEGNIASGVVNFSLDGNMMQIDVRVDGLKPNSMHGLHIHSIGDCRAPNASSAGGHFNPHGSSHGGPDTEPRHIGDLGNIQANASGSAIISVQVTGITLGKEVDSIIGRAIIVHAQADDLSGQPSGNAGPRIACGLISKNPDKFF